MIALTKSSLNVAALAKSSLNVAALAQYFSIGGFGF